MAHVKDTYYFSHDSNASRDPKMLEMRSVYGAEGYGWYWMIVEMMREQSDYQLKLCKCNAFAMHLQCTPDAAKKFVNECINEFELFDSDGEYFWSNSLNRRMGKVEEKSEKARLAALARWGKSDNESDMQPECKRNANAMQTHNNRNADAMQDESACNAIKVNESKVNESKEKENPKEKFRDRPDNSFDFVSSKHMENIKLWLKYKKERKENYKSQNSIRVMYNRLCKLSDDDDELMRKIIDQSIANNWAGLFEYKQENHGKTNRNLSKWELSEQLAANAAESLETRIRGNSGKS